MEYLENLHFFPLHLKFLFLFLAINKLKTHKEQNIFIQ